MKTLPEFISEVRGKLKRATPGPWEQRCKMVIDTSAAPEFVWSEFGWLYTETGLPRQYSVPTADLIASTPTYLAKLLEIVEVQAAALDAVQHQTVFSEQVHQHLVIAAEARVAVSKLLGDV